MTKPEKKRWDAEAILTGDYYADLDVMKYWVACLMPDQIMISRQYGPDKRYFLYQWTTGWQLDCGGWMELCRRVEAKMSDDEYARYEIALREAVKGHRPMSATWKDRVRAIMMTVNPDAFKGVETSDPDKIIEFKQPA